MLSSPTIKDVAKCAGVHFTTVSKALRGNPSIPAATRARIAGLAQRMGYRRNEIFSALSSQRQRLEPEDYTPRMAYLANRSPEAGLLRHAHHRQFIESARSQAEELGYRFEVLYLDEGHYDSASLDAYLRQKGITGLILGAFEADRRSIELDWSNYAVVRIDCGHLHLPVSMVSNDQLMGVRTAFNEIEKLGYMRIGLAMGMQDEEATDDLHLSGLLLAQRNLPQNRRIPPLLFPLGGTHKEATPLLGPWVRKHRIDAVLCTWNSIEIMLRDCGLNCPGDVACACLCLTGPHPTLAGIQCNLDLVGRRVAAQLATLLREDEKGFPREAAVTYVEGQWTPGASAPLKRKGGRA